MFGATALRRKREKERRERAARNSANTIYPFIQPFGNTRTINKISISALFVGVSFLPFLF